MKSRAARNWFQAMKLYCCRHTLGRVALHLACIGRGGKVHFHASGIHREINYVLVERIGCPKRWISRNPKVKTASLLERRTESPDAEFLPASIIRKPSSN